MSTHTPGPWQLGHDLGNALSVVKEVAPNCGRLLLIADVHKGKQNWGGISRNECNANAHLIAAAPDMLDMLCTVLPYIETLEQDKGYKPGAVNTISRQLQAVIAKAEGREI